MRKTVLYIATSLDGYIAEKDGGIDWLTAYDMPKSYDAFLKTVDTVVMGGITYRKIVTELSPGEWAYEGLVSYVVTRRAPGATAGVHFVQQSPCSLVRALKAEPGKNIWICGGAQIVSALWKENLIDRLHLSVIPTVLGDGIRLFPQEEREHRLRLVGAQSEYGIVDLIYERA